MTSDTERVFKRYHLDVRLRLQPYWRITLQSIANVHQQRNSVHGKEAARNSMMKQMKKEIPREGK